MSRVTGRTVIATTLAEKEVLHQLGLKSLRVPRKLNPYQVARRLQRATLPHPDIEFLRGVAVRTHFVPSSVVPLGTASADLSPPSEEYNGEVAAE